LFGGWRIVHTMAPKSPTDSDARFLRGDGRGDHAVHGDALGVPVSTTHTITGAIVGVGAARRVSAVRWNVARDIVIAWSSPCRWRADRGALLRADEVVWMKYPSSRARNQKGGRRRAARQYAALPWRLVATALKSCCLVARHAALGHPKGGR